MNKWMAASVIGVILVSGCQREDIETKKQLAQLQAQLEAEKTEKLQREAREREQRQKEEQLEREEEIRKEVEESVKARLQMEMEEKAAKQKMAPQQNAESVQPTGKVKFTEKVVRYPATVVTQSGYGDLSLRGEPSTTGIEISKVYDGNEVQVITKTNKCEVIRNIQGCWVKVQLDNTKGYMFDGYLNREVLSQSEKKALQGRSNNSDNEDCDDCEN